MTNHQLLEYVQKSIQARVDTQHINAVLLKHGWEDNQIKEALEQAHENIKHELAALVLPAPPKRSEEVGETTPLHSDNERWDIEIRSSSASQVLLYLGALIVVLAGVIYFGINWGQWGALTRSFAIFLPTLICYVVGSLMWFRDEHKKHGAIFLIVGSLLLPCFLAVTFKELAFFTGDAGLVTSLVTLFAYLVSSYVFRASFWTFLYQSAGLFAYYFVLKRIGIGDFFGQPAMAWLFLLPGTACLLLSLFYDKKSDKDAAQYSYTIGFVVLAVSFMRLFAETFSTGKGSMAWLFVALGILYFLFGAFYERKDFKRYSGAPCLIGVALIFFPLLRLGIDGTLLKSFGILSTASNLDIVGWSSLIVGAIYLLSAVILHWLKRHGLEKATEYREFFNFVGSFCVLSAITYLGTGGHKPFYETLLLLTSIGFVFVSIPTHIPQYLSVGTLFLVVYIFAVGGEYFQNQVGWPITLFVAGLVSMGVGVVMDRVRKKVYRSQR